MKKDLTEIICILDRSGSMASVLYDAIGGFNKFIEEQKKVPGECQVTVILFDNEYKTFCENLPIAKVPVMNETNYVPRGMTALLDAIGKTIDDVGHRLSETPEEARPEKVLVVILTDGFENASVNYKKPGQIKEMVRHQEGTYNWKFVYLAANQDAFAVGSQWGLAQASCVSYQGTGAGTRQAYGVTNSMVTNYRTTGDIHGGEGRENAKQPT